ncbi:P-loop containing nucleoside triphosphate hydrolase protein [Syncephalis plumigaleata]|nr:P-loop containing nucleoside triphosphate hydrolase protein [Syncephalis plumigaleata]
MPTARRKPTKEAKSSSTRRNVVDSQSSTDASTSSTSNNTNTSDALATLQSASIYQLARVYWCDTSMDIDHTATTTANDDEASVTMTISLPVYTKPYDSTLVSHIYEGYIHVKNTTKSTASRILELESTQYLEQYLWPNYDPSTSTEEHVISIAVLVNEKRRQRVPTWEIFGEDSERFNELFHRIMKLSLAEGHRDLWERERLLTFMGHATQSLEHPLTRTETMRLFSVGIWHALCSKSRRESALSAAPPMVKKIYKALDKRHKAADEEGKKRMELEWHWLSLLIIDATQVMASIPEEGELEDTMPIRYCERFLELTIGLISQLPTRRFVNTLLDDHHLVLLCKKTAILYRTPEGETLHQLWNILSEYIDFEVDDHTGRSLTIEERVARHNDRLLAFQGIAYAEFRDSLTDLALSHLSAIEQPNVLREYLNQLSTEDLYRLCDAVQLRRVKLARTNVDAENYSPEFLVDAFIQRYHQRTSQLDRINTTSLYPNEVTLFDELLTETTNQYNDDTVLPLPRLNLQFLTLYDYLRRSFTLCQLESAYEIRQDIEDAVQRLAPQRAYPDGVTVFNGWSRMATKIEMLGITDVAQPALGEERPQHVTAQVKINLSMFSESIRRDWDTLRPGDIVYLLTIRAQDWTHQVWKNGATSTSKRSFREHYGVDYARGAQIIEIIQGRGYNTYTPADQPKMDVQERLFRVQFDPNQYYEDSNRKSTEDIYPTLNVLLRRHAKENNFKGVLETMRDLMQSELLVPDWLQNVFLGNVYYKQMPNQPIKIDYRDTFLDADHLRASFPNAILKTSDDTALPEEPPYVIERVGETADGQEQLLVTSYQLPNMGPYASDLVRKNAVPFTPAQVEAIRAGTSPGLTLIVGPPGTGKTDVAVQIISNIYHNYPQQRTLLITRSNQALNQLFEKIIALDIDDRHLLRLGHGEEALDTEESFNKAGRVSSFLERRVLLLQQVSRLATSLGLSGDHGYTCETAGYFYLYHVLARWEPFETNVTQHQWDSSQIALKFPFTNYFSDAPQPLFPINSPSGEAMEIAHGCFRHIKHIFEELEQIRAFELLRTNKDRANYLLTKEAKIVAMTTMHAALKRRELVSLGFEYDTVIMEEAAQVLESETLIPLLLQESANGQGRLKRVVLIGDHHQLPPVVQNPAFEKYCNLEQSMFARFVRLGVPTIELDRQGRARPSIAKLYNWRYEQLSDLPSVTESHIFHLANPGFTYEYQFIDVADYEGKGETAPLPHYYQNLGEAEYVVAVYQYMRLLGYPADKITILATYNGQRALLMDVLQRRCGWHPYFGMPSKVATVDQYQGQQNDYVLLSLVRTKHIGYMRDVRRLTVAMSRARLGLYIFGRMRVFEACAELKPMVTQWRARPLQLSLQPKENSNSERKMTDHANAETIADVAEMGKRVYQMTQDQLGANTETKDEDMQELQLAAQVEIEAMQVDQQTSN